MNIYLTDVKPSVVNPTVLMARCPKCGAVLVLSKGHAVCDECGEEVFLVEED